MSLRKKYPHLDTICKFLHFSNKTLIVIDLYNYYIKNMVSTHHITLTIPLTYYINFVLYFLAIPATIVDRACPIRRYIGQRSSKRDNTEVRNNDTSNRFRD